MARLTDLIVDSYESSLRDETLAAFNELDTFYRVSTAGGEQPWVNVVQDIRAENGAPRAQRKSLDTGGSRCDSVGEDATVASAAGERSRGESTRRTIGSGVLVARSTGSPLWPWKA